MSHNNNNWAQIWKQEDEDFAEGAAQFPAAKIVALKKSSAEPMSLRLRKNLFCFSLMVCFPLSAVKPCFMQNIWKEGPNFFISSNNFFTPLV